MRAFILIVPLLSGCLLSETPSLCQGDEKTHACRLAALDADAGSKEAAQEKNEPTGYQKPGEACTCDDECESANGREGMCVLGVCMTRALSGCESGACSYPDYCANFEETGPTCVPKCENQCDGVCSQDGYCVPGEQSACDASCSAFCG